MAKVGSTLPIMFLTKSAKDMFLTKSAKDWRRGPPTEFRRLAREIMKAMKLQEKEDMGEMAMLTPAQKKLLRRFAKGNSDGQIAQELSVKESVIADQRAKMKVTLQVHSQAHFKAIADLLAFGQAGNKAPNDSGRGKIPRVHTREQQHEPTHPRGIFHQVDRLESLGDHGQHDAVPRS
jgi:DNA-binding CsgD family transcriptional regulator